MVTCVNIPDKDTLLVGDSNGSLRVYQLTSGEALRVFDAVKEAKRVQDLEGKGEEADRESSLVSLSVSDSTPTEEEEPVRRKRIAPGREVVQAIVCSVPSTDGGSPAPCLAVGLEKGTVVVFDLKTAEAVLVLETHPGLCYLGFIRSAHLLVIFCPSALTSVPNAGSVLTSACACMPPCRCFYTAALRLQVQQRGVGHRPVARQRAAAGFHDRAGGDP